MIGFGSIGRGTLPLIERHFAYDPRELHVIEPSDEHRTVPGAARACISSTTPVTRGNYRALLTPDSSPGGGASA